MYSYWAISMASFVRYGYLGALQGLWAAPFLLYGLRMDEITAGNVILVMGIGYMIGLPLSGFLSDRVFRSRKKVILFSLGAFAVLAICPLRWDPQVSLWAVIPVFVLLGLAAAPGQILYAHMKELIPDRMMAQAMTAVNLFTMLGAGIMVNLIGLFLGDEPSQIVGPAGFRPLWYIGFVCLVIVFALYSFVPDSRALRRYRT
jgi:MFS family permease